jgi:hypothetical protein
MIKDLKGNCHCDVGVSSLVWIMMTNRIYIHIGKYALAPTLSILLT